VYRLSGTDCERKSKQQKKKWAWLRDGMMAYGYVYVCILYVMWKNMVEKSRQESIRSFLMNNAPTNRNRKLKGREKNCKRSHKHV
jgi:hypothetical protein